MLPGSRRRRIRAAYDALIEAIRTADAHADAHRERARQAHLAALVELWLREAGLDAAAGDPVLGPLLHRRAFAEIVARIAADDAADDAAHAAPGPVAGAAPGEVVDPARTDRGGAAGPGPHDPPGHFAHVAGAGGGGRGGVGPAGVGSVGVGPDGVGPVGLGPADVVSAVNRIVAAAAPGPAGDDPTGWLGRTGTVEADGAVPRLWRIGVGRLRAASEPFEVAVPLLDEAHLQVGSHPEHRGAAIALVETLVLRVLSTLRPGVVEVHVWDGGQLTGPLPGLHPLARSGLLTVHDPAGLGLLLEDLSDRIRRVHTRVLVDGHPSLAAQAAAGQARTEPWVLVVLAGNRAALEPAEHRQLQRVARGGLACGIVLVLLDVPLTMAAPVETVDLDANGTARSSMTGRLVTVVPDPALPQATVSAACHTIAEAHEVWRSRIGTFADLLPTHWGRDRSAAGLHAPVGFTDGRPVEVALADAAPHALIGGPSGSGKTNLLLGLIGALATRYDPDELELYLLDFKEGVSFAPFAPGRREASWLPQARLIGVNINTDREFGLALLQFLAEEMRRRAAAAKEHEVSKLEDLRAVDPDGRWPRIVAVIDEFQYLFAERDAVTRQAVLLLEDVARRGRSQGIHLVLASQDVSGIEAFWLRPAIFEQFVLRIGLPRARRVLHERNEATLDLPRWHAVINHESGMRHGNEIVRVPNASVRGTVDAVQQQLHARWGAAHPPPRLFDGNRAPLPSALLADLPDDGMPRALVGQAMDVAGRPAVAPLPRAPGRNLAVLGAGPTDALRVLHAAASGFLVGAPAPVSVVLVELVDVGVEALDRIGQAATAGGHHAERVGGQVWGSRLVELAAVVATRLRRAGDGGAGRGAPAGAADGGPVLVVLPAADAAETTLDRAGTEALRTVLHSGPEVGVHVLGWWRSVARLRSLLTMGATIEDVGAWVALDVQGSELTPLLPGSLLSWSPRPGRGLFFDRAQHAAPEVIIVPVEEES